MIRETTLAIPPEDDPIPEPKPTHSKKRVLKEMAGTKAIAMAVRDASRVLAQALVGDYQPSDGYTLHVSEDDVVTFTLSLCRKP